METAEALDGNDGATLQELQRRHHRIPLDSLAIGVDECQARTAHRAARRLGMKTPIGRIAVFMLAGRTQGERRQAGLRPIIGQRPGYGIARSAMRTGDEGVTPAATSGIKHFGQACRANGGVVADGSLDRAAAALGNGEAVDARWLGTLRFNSIDARQRWRLSPQTRQEHRHLLLSALGSNLDALAIVLHPTGNTGLARQTPDIGSKADTLDEAGDADAAGDGDGHIQAGAASAPFASQLSQSTMPSPEVADIRITSILGLTRRAYSMARSTSNDR